MVHFSYRGQPTTTRLHTSAIRFWYFERGYFKSTYLEWVESTRCYAGICWVTNSNCIASLPAIRSFSATVFSQAPNIISPIPANTSVSTNSRKYSPLLVIALIIIVAISGVAYAHVQKIGPFMEQTNTNTTSSENTTVTTASDSVPSAVSSQPKGPSGLALGALGSVGTHRVAGGTTVEMEKIFLRAMTELIQLQKIDFKLTSGVAQDVTQVTLWNGSTLVGKGAFAKGATAVTITMTPSILLPKYSMTEQTGELTLIVKVDLAKVGAGEPGTDGDHIAVDVTNATGVGQTSGTVIDSSWASEHPSYSSDYGVILSSGSAVSAVPSVTKVSPNLITATTPDGGTIGKDTQMTVSGTGFTSSSVVLLYDFPPIKPTSVSTDGTKIVFTFPANYPTLMKGNNWSVSSPIMISNVGTIRFDSGLGSVPSYIKIIPPILPTVLKISSISANQAKPGITVDITGTGITGKDKDVILEFYKNEEISRTLYPQAYTNNGNGNYQLSFWIYDTMFIPADTYQLRVYDGINRSNSVPFTYLSK